MKPPIPSNEAERMRSLKLYRILDSGSEKAFDDLTRLAAAICETPISLITLIEGERQWFKSKVGMTLTETTRDVSFCAHALVDNRMLVVEDATKDPRFADNPYVTAESPVRFYAGAPLVMADGNSLGTLCVVDRKPRQLSAHQLEALGILRQAVVSQIELRRALQDFRLVEQLLPICAWCRDVRNPDGSWRTLHDYVASAMPVTHGMCPRCSTAMLQN
jgi:GAF domain-containing protein